ncbi:hypothetical protein Rhopal_005241-T1 [Rhodotorula paludigena]|uniref:Major facilitator superfamily (MFS) profile domain-containing protein n=1 Tax=Rhodotorula paludigena TaxID=86838 RepID=A0AAV5GHW0_9BASI|nr:hypothetical protein Rhopal_005241-T1 [Rhodotorula paludigena]
MDEQAQPDKLAARGRESEPAPALQDVEKRAGAEEGGDLSASSPPLQEKPQEVERDEDGSVEQVYTATVDYRLRRHVRILLHYHFSLTVLLRSCCSSMVAFTYPGVEAEFHVSQEVATLALSLFVLGMGLFPLLVGPLSEWYGRSPVYFIGFALYIIFNFLVAFSNNIGALLVGRFLAGAAGSAFLSVAGGTVADLFRPHEVGAPMGFYTAGPIISGFINEHLDWRYTWYILIAWAGAEYAALLFFVPETYLPAVLKARAKKLRKAGRTDVRAPIEIDDRSIPRVLLTSCYRPFQILALEPMALVLCTWTAILLGILYMFFSAYGIVYRQYGFSTQIVGLTYIPLGLGVIIGGLCHPIWARYYRRKTEQLGRRPPPEEHLRKGLYGVILCPLSLFWFAFTTYHHVHWIVSLIATVPFGIGMLWSFQAVFLYLVDAFRPVAASAMAANSAMRSSFAAAFPLFTTQMFNTLGTQYALMLTAFLCLAMVPFPFLFFKVGHKYRRGSKFANSE